MFLVHRGNLTWWKMVQWVNVEQMTMIATFLTRGHQGVESHLLRWQFKMDGDQVIAGTFLAGIAKVLEEGLACTSIH